MPENRNSLWCGAALNSLNIRQTRSRHLDTLFASISIKVGANDAVTSPVISLGDQNNSYIQFGGCLTPAVRVDALAAGVKIGITVLNSGNNDINEKIADIAEAIVSGGVDDVVPGSGEIFDVMYGVLGPLIFANCDGPVVLQVLYYGGSPSKAIGPNLPTPFLSMEPIVAITRHLDVDRTLSMTLVARLSGNRRSTYGTSNCTKLARYVQRTSK